MRDPVASLKREAVCGIGLRRQNKNPFDVIVARNEVEGIDEHPAEDSDTAVKVGKTTLLFEEFRRVRCAAV